MTKDELIQKWLRDDLNPQELEAFKALEDYEALMKLSDSLKNFKAPEFEEQATFENISKSISTTFSSKPKSNWLKPVLRVAALLVISFSIYFYTTTLDTNISTLTAEKTTIELPDYSEVKLNAQSTITYNKKGWKNSRDLKLEGEAYFKVQKGSNFKVQTKTGIVTVLGTQFLVKNRDNIFEVICYEGSVSVKTKEKNIILEPGSHFLIIDGKFIATEKENATEPSWLNNESSFKSMPYKFVLRELERQYQVTINTEKINLNALYTGRFVHNNLEMALKSITLPLNIDYTNNNGLIVLHDK